MNQLLNQNGFAHACAAEQTDFAALGIGGKQVNDLNAGFQLLHHGALVGKGGGLPMNGPTVTGEGGFVVHRLPHNAEQTTQTLTAHRHGDAAAGCVNGHAPAQAFRRREQNAADHAVSQMLRNFHDHLPAVGLGI